MPKDIRTLPLIEQLAIEQALFSKLGEDVSTKNPDSLRGIADADVIRNYHATGARSYDVNINGTKVGTYSVRVTKEKPAQTDKHLVVTDSTVLEAFIQSDECAEERKEYLVLMARNFSEFMLETYGIVCDGCEVQEHTIPFMPSTVSGTTLRIDADKVVAAIDGYLPTAIAGFLGGGENGE